MFGSNKVTPFLHLRHPGYKWQVAAAIAVPLVSNAIFGDNGQSAANNAATNASQTSANASATLANIASQRWNDYKNTYMPAESAMVSQALNTGSPDDIAQAEGRAGATAEGQVGMQEAATQRNLTRVGAAPSSGEAVAMQNQNAITGAATVAGAENNAGLAERQLGFTEKQDAVNAGNQVASNATSGLSSAAAGAASAANAGVNAASNAGNMNAANMAGLSSIISNIPNIVPTQAAAPITDLSFTS